MNYRSLQGGEAVSFETAVRRGLAPDNGLYFPTDIPQLPASFFENIAKLSKEEIGFEVIRPFVAGEIDDASLLQIVTETLCFDFPVVPLDDKTAVLELFHGPTLAFKDVGARFMSRCLAYFNKKQTSVHNTVLVATSGDTGGAVADGFLGVSGIEVAILYPEGKVSDIQERQLTTLGRNVRAFAVAGSFDDCQAMVKRAFLDSDFKDLGLTSANSINVARWLPQMMYYFLAYAAAENKQQLAICVPSGNFGNICAGMIAKKMGLPIAHFVAATNVNDTVPRYMQTKELDPKPTIPTISNAMDVSIPSNFVRVLELFPGDALAQLFSAVAFTDAETKVAMRQLYDTFGYVADPHGAVGYLGLRAFQKAHPNYYGIFLETAHPIKFPEVVEDTLQLTLSYPVAVQKLLNLEKKFERISSYSDLKAKLLP